MVFLGLFCMMEEVRMRLRALGDLGPFLDDD